MTEKLSLAQMRAKLIEQETNKGKKFENTSDNASYPFWNIPDNSTAHVRFLPDGNPDNGWFHVSKKTINLPFPGVLGASIEKPLKVSITCPETFNKKCPIQEEIKSLNWWNGTDAEKALARTYYRKVSYIYQGFVCNSVLKEENVPENPIRRFVLNQSLHDKIIAAIKDPDMEDVLPTDYDNGLDFRIVKTKQGQYANYDNSSFSRKPRSLNQTEREAIEQYGLFDLSKFLSKEPDSTYLTLMMELFEASINGELFDQEKFKIFRPYGLNNNGGNTASQPKVYTPKVVETSSDEYETEESYSAPVAKVAPVVEEAKKPTKDVRDVLAKLRANKQN